MNISYANETIRNHCYSTNPDLSNTHFTISEIKLIRTFIADLRAAPSLADVPFKYDYVFAEKRSNQIYIKFSDIKIQCQIISSLEKPEPNKVKRIKIINIFKIDFQKYTP